MLSLVNNAVDTISKKRRMKIDAIRNSSIVMIEIAHNCEKENVSKCGRKLFPADDDKIKIRTNIAMETAKKNNGNISFRIHENEFISTVIFTGVEE